jgi:hypothetical protein
MPLATSVSVACSQENNTSRRLRLSSNLWLLDVLVGHKEELLEVFNLSSLSQSLLAECAAVSLQSLASWCPCWTKRGTFRGLHSCCVLPCAQFCQPFRWCVSQRCCNTHLLKLFRALIGVLMVFVIMVVVLKDDWLYVEGDVSAVPAAGTLTAGALARCFPCTLVPNAKIHQKSHENNSSGQFCCAN